MKKLYSILIFSLLCFCALIMPKNVFAATYTYNSNLRAESYANNYYGNAWGYVIGHNTTQGITSNLSYELVKVGGGSNAKWTMNYFVPDDGCTWKVDGRIYTTVWTTVSDGTDGTYIIPTGVGSDSFSNTHITTGSFTGTSPKTATDAANLAATNASNAATASNNAKSAADAAKISADTAASRAQTTINQTWYGGKYGGTTESTADIAGYIRNTQLPSIDTKINNLQTSVTNIQNSDTMPPVVDVQTVSGARATSGSSIQAVVTVTDNRPGPYTYSINGGSYNTLPSDGKVSLPITVPGNNVITVYGKDVAGNIGSKTIVIRKL